MRLRLYHHRTRLASRTGRRAPDRRSSCCIRSGSHREFEPIVAALSGASAWCCRTCRCTAIRDRPAAPVHAGVAHGGDQWLLRRGRRPRASWWVTTSARSWRSGRSWTAAPRRPAWCCSPTACTAPPRTPPSARFGGRPHGLATVPGMDLVLSHGARLASGRRSVKAERSEQPAGRDLMRHAFADVAVTAPCTGLGEVRAPLAAQAQHGLLDRYGSLQSAGAAALGRR